MDPVASPSPTLTIQVESGRYGEVLALFLAWADADDDVQVLFTPDTFLAVDLPTRAGRLLDEVYWVTITIDRGADDFRRALDASLPGDTWRVVDDPVPTALHDLARESSPRLADVRHLL